ncbi:DsrE family protein [Roseivirga sp.]|uniref:DsrE family protein n=1 Tax=Roseivirga sp. TaxID=1964215 RepID=UPI003B524082
MKNFRNIFLATCCFFLSIAAHGQEMINPVIKGYGGIMDAPHAMEKPDPNMEYKIIIDVATGDSNPDQVMYSLVNVARLLNLHAMGGVPKEKMHVVLAIHASAVWSVLDNETYKAKYDVDNPHLPLFKELKDAGVQIFVCSQSLMGRNIDHTKLAPEVVVATSMLTTLTTYQLKGYAALKF